MLFNVQGTRSCACDSSQPSWHQPTEAAIRHFVQRKLRFQPGGQRDSQHVLAVKDGQKPGEWSCSVLVLVFTVSYTRQFLQLLVKDPVSAQSPGGPFLGLPKYRVALPAEQGPRLSCPFVPFPLISLFPSHPTPQKLHISGMCTRMRLLCLLSLPPNPQSLSRPSGVILSIPPKHPLSLRARSPARVQMETGPGRVKFLDLFICSLLLHLLMSLSPKPDDPSSELGRAREDGALRTRGTPHAPRKAALGSLPASAARKRPRAAKGSSGPRSGASRTAAATAYLGEPAPELPAKPPSSYLYGEGSRGRRGGEDNSFPTLHRARR